MSDWKYNQRKPLRRKEVQPGLRVVVGPNGCVARGNRQIFRRFMGGHGEDQINELWTDDVALIVATQNDELGNLWCYILPPEGSAGWMHHNELAHASCLETCGLGEFTRVKGKIRGW